MNVRSWPEAACRRELSEIRSWESAVDPSRTLSSINEFRILPDSFSLSNLILIKLIP